MPIISRLPQGGGSGTAVITDVLAGKTFTNNNDSDLVGTIPSKTAQTYTPSTSVQTVASGQYLSGVQTISAVSVPVANVLAGTTIAGTAGTMPNRGSYRLATALHNQTVAIPAGYHDGTGYIWYYDANHVASNIKLNVNIGGVVGTLNPSAPHGEQIYATAGTYTFYVPASVTRIEFIAHAGGGSGGGGNIVSRGGGGGAGGVNADRLDVSPGQGITIVVGNRASNSSVDGRVAYGGQAGYSPSGQSPGNPGSGGAGGGYGTAGSAGFYGTGGNSAGVGGASGGVNANGINGGIGAGGGGGGVIPDGGITYGGAGGFGRVVIFW